MTRSRRGGRLLAAAAAGLLLCASSCSSGAKASPLSSARASSSSGEGDGSGFTPPRFVDQHDLPEVEGEARDAGGRVAAGTTVSVDIPSTVSHFDARTARVYLPPAWFASTSPKLPILILLPGVPGGPTDWTDDGNADLIANDFASHHHGLAPIMVMPDVTGQESGDSECVNSSRYGNVETYLTVDVPTFVRATFRAAAGRGSLAVAGLSAGGTCSTVLALRNPRLFETFASFSGFATPTYLDDTVAQSVPVLYDGSEAAYLAHDPMTLLAHNKYPDTAAWFEAGTSDQPPWADAQRLAAASRQAGMQQVCLLGIPGGHTWTVWQQSFTAALPWLAARVGLVPSGSSGSVEQGCPS